MKKYLITTIIMIIIAMSVFYLSEAKNQNKIVLNIYHAGSLSKPLADAATEFEKEHPNVEVQLHSYGSVDAIRQITDLKKNADIIAIADYDLINKRMIPEYTTWNLQFATNELVIAYSNKSKYHQQINKENWYKIFTKPDVKYGFSDPNSDPCGYRAVMMLQLAEKYYNNDTIFEDIISSHCNIKAGKNGTNHVIYTPGNLEPDSKLIIRPKEVDLMQAIESGAIDYLIIYKSVAKQHNTRYIELPDELKIKYTSYEDEYKKIKLIQYSDNNEKKETVTLKPIIYGITILKTSKNKKLAEEFIKLLITQKGRNILKKNSQDPIPPTISTIDISRVPPTLKPYVKVQ